MLFDVSVVVVVSNWYIGCLLNGVNSPNCANNCCIFSAITKLLHRCWLQLYIKDDLFSNWSTILDPIRILVGKAEKPSGIQLRVKVDSPLLINWQKPLGHGTVLFWLFSHKRSAASEELNNFDWSSCWSLMIPEISPT
jgi:hypothetical protein